MTRIAVILCALAACDVGSVLPPGSNPGGPDGGQHLGSGDGQSVGSNGCVNAGTPQPAHTHQSPVQAGNASNKGLDCMGAGACHAQGGGLAPQFAFAGTLYTSAQATAPASGAVVVISFAGGPLQAIADMDGNFYNSVPVTYPATAMATTCPTVLPMTQQLVTGNGGCNSCHTLVQPATTTPLYFQ